MAASMARLVRSHCALSLGPCWGRFCGVDEDRFSLLVEATAAPDLDTAQRRTRCARYAASSRRRGPHT
jgi:hypothetical protein